MVLLSSNPLADRVVRLDENYRIAVSRLLDQQVLDVSSGASMWGWPGIITGSLGLTLSWRPVRNQIIAVRSWLAGKTTQPLLLPSGRFGAKFFLLVAAVLGVTTLTHCSLIEYSDVDWAGGEDGVSEWWSAWPYLVA